MVYNNRTGNYDNYHYFRHLTIMEVTKNLFRQSCPSILIHKARAYEISWGCVNHWIIRLSIYGPIFCQFSFFETYVQRVRFVITWLEGFSDSRHQSQIHTTSYVFFVYNYFMSVVFGWNELLRLHRRIKNGIAKNSASFRMIIFVLFSELSLYLNSLEKYRKHMFTIT